MAQDGEEQLTLSDIIFNAVDKKLCDMFTAMPCRLVSYDPATNTCSVQPAIKRKYKSEATAQTLPVVSAVPVVFPKGAKSHLLLPITSGDEGLLVFSQRSIDGWLDSGGEIDPEDVRKFALSDAIFIPGLHSAGNVPARGGQNTSVELKNDKAVIELKPNGKFKVTNGTEELFDLTVTFMEKMVETLKELGEVHQTNTIFGPQKPINFANYTVLKLLVDELKTKMETLKG